MGLVNTVEHIVFTIHQKETGMESRNATFLESLLYVPLPMDTEIDYKETDCTEEDTYINDVIDHTSFLDPFVLRN